MAGDMVRKIVLTTMVGASIGIIYPLAAKLPSVSEKLEPFENVVSNTINYFASHSPRFTVDNSVSSILTNNTFENSSSDPEKLYGVIQSNGKTLYIYKHAGAQTNEISGIENVFEK